MKSKNQATSKLNAPSARKVRIEFQHDNAQTVFIAGTFNDWRPNVTPMIAVANGKWVKELSLAPGRYEYRFIVDGEWTNDPKTEQAPNEHGSFNSVLIVGGEYETAMPAIQI